MSCFKVSNIMEFSNSGEIVPLRNTESIIKFGYWEVRGYGQAVRNLLRYRQVKFEDIRYSYGVEPNFSKDDWLKVKNKLGLDFPNLPYLIDGELKITQSQAIIRYLARKYNLRAQTDPEKSMEDMLELQIIDIRNILTKAVYVKSYHSEKEFQQEMLQVKEALHDSLTQLERFISGENDKKKWLLGDRLSYIDFLAYEYFDWYREFVQSDCFDPFVRMSEYLNRFEQLPTLKHNLASDLYRKAHCLSPFCRLGYRFNGK